MEKLENESNEESRREEKIRVGFLLIVFQESAQGTAALV